MNIVKKIIAFTRWRDIKISYGITVCNEVEELKKLLICLLNNINKKDEIIILSDEESVTTEVLDVINAYMSQNKHIKHISHPLNKDFATFKNHLIPEALGDYLFQIDADEVPNVSLLKNIRYHLLYYKKVDCFKIPRINIVHGLEEDYVKRMGWNVDLARRINYPDLQMRLFRLNKGIIWANKVHEILINTKKIKNLPHSTDENCLYHIKDIERQKSQNQLYDTIIQ